MPEKIITTTLDDVPEIERALIAWFDSQGLNSMDACFVMAHLIGAIFFQDHKEGAKDVDEGVMVMNAITANVAKGLHPTTGFGKS